MNRRRGGVAAATVSCTLVAATLINATGALAGPSDSGGGFNKPPGTTDDGYVYAYDAVTKKNVRIPAKDAGHPDPGVTYTYKLTPDCPQNNEDGSLLCLGATEYCATVGQAGIHETVWRAEKKPVVGNFGQVGAVCVGKSSGKGEQELESEVSEYERTHLPVASPQVQPAKTAVVNIPVLVSVKPMPPQTMQVTEPTPGRLVATPHYSWTFDDGTTLTGPGRPYDGVDPRVHPDHYVAHTYTQRQKNASVTLTVTWTATFTQDGNTVVLPKVTMPAIEKTYTVKEMRAVLVAN